VISYPGDFIIVEGFYHGPMKYREGPMWFVCAGFDGEGCLALLGEEQVFLICSRRPTKLDDHCLAWEAEKDLVTGKLRIKVKPAI
jgi:hypothetical protein